MTRLSIALLASLALAACGTSGDTATDSAAATVAPSASANDDVADVAEYELTMDKVNRFYDAMRNIAVAYKDVPEAERPNMNAANASLGDLVTQMEREPRIRRAIERADLSPREYVTIMMTMLSSGMAYGITQMRPNDDADSLAREMNVNPKNLTFMKEHQAELAAKQAEMQSLMGDDQ